MSGIYSFFNSWFRALVEFWSNVIGVHSPLSTFLRYVFRKQTLLIMGIFAAVRIMVELHKWIGETITHGLSNVQAASAGLFQSVGDMTTQAVDGVGGVDLGHMLAIGNTFLPLTEAAGMAVLCFEIWVLCGLIRVVKSCIPAISG